MQSCVYELQAIRKLRYAITATDHGRFYRVARTLDIERLCHASNQLIL